MNPVVSIIVPVYNVPDYLPRCFDAILAQTFPHWEAILVDDGSTVSACARICDEYAARDARFRVIHKENGGVCSARNAGLRAAAGQYVTFCDQDDYYSPWLLESALSVQREHPDTLVIWDVVSDEARLPDSAFPGTGGSCALYRRDQCDAVYMRMVFATVWNKLLRRDLLCGLGPDAEEPAASQCEGASPPDGGLLLFDEENQVGTEDLPFALEYATRFFAHCPQGRFCLIEDYFPHFYEGKNEKSVSKSARHFAHYCEQTLERDGPLTRRMEGFFGCTPDGMAPVYQFYLHCLCYGLFLLPEFNAVSRSGQILRDPEFQRVLCWLGQHKVYTPFYLPLRWHMAALVRLIFRLEQSGSGWYWKFYWLGYYLLGGNWKR